MFRYQEFLCFGIIFTPSFILICVCPVLEWQKIILFNESNGELKYNVWIEYSYLALTIVLIILYLFLCGCCCCVDLTKLNYKYKLATLLWLLVPILYTLATYNELGKIPMYCPSNYPYTSRIIQDACEIRLTNLVCMWLNFIFLILFMLSLCSLNGQRFEMENGSDNRNLPEMVDIYSISKKPEFLSVETSESFFNDRRMTRSPGGENYDLHNE
ncbi:hypothetical protein C2G38_2087097 [Gigaspora rosea]|uniref:Uncharacterized protein n=1 Tax=Gigaspora rosea TaxID=44941 RepID=A0A397VD20_9GLOM|nr:hypothetical protein C2G38_2087097 [Gigaspora rosea]